MRTISFLYYLFLAGLFLALLGPWLVALLLNAIVEELIDEIKLATMEAARQLERHISTRKRMDMRESKYKTIMRYVAQLSSDLGDITGRDAKEIEKSLRALIEKRYKEMLEERSEADQTVS
jgi:DNA topoisomerase VI subunit B